MAGKFRTVRYAPSVGAVMALGCLVLPVRSQEALRMSLAAQQAAEARQRERSTPYYNIKLGPWTARFQSSLGLEAVDNVRLSENDPEADLILRPELRITSSWQVTDQNSLSLSSGIGYAKYLKETELDNFFVTPGSDLWFNVQAGDVLINLHDRFSLSQEAYEQPSISGTGEFGHFENTVGTRVDWDLNKIIVTLGYDHNNYLSTTPDFDYLTRASELFIGQLGYAAHQTAVVGVEVGGGFTDYEQRVLNDISQFNAGLFSRYHLSEYLNFQLSVGYTTYMPDRNATTNAASNVDAIYGDLTLTHRPHAKFAYGLSVGRQIQLGIYSDTLDLYYARLNQTWYVLRKFNLRTSQFYEHAEESRGNPEILDRFGVGLELSYPLTQKLSAATRYDFVTKDSNLPRANYTQNRLVFELLYRF
jgi:hypothetical protein